MQYNKVEICGVNTNSLVVLKEKEKIELLKKYREKNDMYAREKLICGNLRLVLSVIQRFSNRGEDMDDLPEEWADFSCNMGNHLLMRTKYMLKFRQFLRRAHPYRAWHRTALI